MAAYRLHHRGHRISRELKTEARLVIRSVVLLSAPQMFLSLNYCWRRTPQSQSSSSRFYRRPHQAFQKEPLRPADFITLDFAHQWRKRVWPKPF